MPERVLSGLFGLSAALVFLMCLSTLERMQPGQWYLLARGQYPHVMRGVCFGVDGETHRYIFLHLRPDGVIERYTYPTDAARDSWDARGDEQGRWSGAALVVSYNGTLLPGRERDFAAARIRHALGERAA